jgi:hypothetical protein
MLTAVNTHFRHFLNISLLSALVVGRYIQLINVTHYRDLLKAEPTATVVHYAKITEPYKPL